MAMTLLIGTLLGFLTGLGIGGGSLLILWLTMIQGMDPLTARGINLLFFVPSAIIACFFKLKQGSLPIRRILPAIITGCISAAVFSFLSTGLNTDLLKSAFGILLLAAGIRELLHK